MHRAILPFLRIGSFLVSATRANGLTPAQVWSQTEWTGQPIRHDRIGELIRKEIVDLDVKRVLEIGGQRNPYEHFFSDGVEYLNMDLFTGGDKTIKADITSCPELESEQFDVILSCDVFEHLNAPWKAGAEITRLLRPGGVTFHSTLFAWRYHPCPKDYFRFTPDGLRQLFPDLDCTLAAFDDTERRRDIYGNGTYRLEPDAFGGWREHWRVHYAGRKAS